MPRRKQPPPILESEMTYKIGQRIVNKAQYKNEVDVPGVILYYEWGWGGKGYYIKLDDGRHIRSYDCYLEPEK